MKIPILLVTILLFIYLFVYFFAFLCILTGKACDLSVTQGWGPGEATFTTCPDRQFADKC